MFFKEKINRVVDVDKIEKEFAQNDDKIDLEKNDILALFISAFIVFVPVLVIVIGGLFLISKLFFGF